ncbi:MAG: flagellar hook protein FlgE [Proteobacteria bacterium]|nr:flagellar hook protein FlgE [Pseudomonadota bacterium]MBU1738938.1 flagellar hook protein FlgE [Pseudomonadota bacterium]
MIRGTYSALGALQSFSRKVSSTANNVANSNTPGYKATRVTFQGGPTQTVSTASGPEQIGQGPVVGSISQNFNQGYLEDTGNPTDMAIGGNGFFMLRDPESGEADIFSRVGGFDFNKDGFLVNPAGYHVQGWSLDPATGDRLGSIGDINLGSSTSPVATRQATVIFNLDSRTPNENVSTSLFDSWDGRNAASANPAAPIDPANFDYSSTFRVHDSQGASHELTVYFDRTANDNEWEFLVTTDPLADRRSLDSAQQTAFAPHVRYSAANHKGAGAMMYGTINFNGSGQITALTAYDVPPDGQVSPSLATNRMTLAATDPYYRLPFNTTGDTANQQIELNFGARFSGQGTSFQPEPLASTQYADNSTTIFQDQDGFAAGFLKNISVDRRGIISAGYSNGQVLQKAQVTLASFNSADGLKMVGAGVYRETAESGAPTTGAPGEIGLGRIGSNSLEQSNVELAEELPRLLLTRRFFQANLKIIQEEDKMLGSLLDIKS